MKNNLFKGQDTNTKEWIYGNLIKTPTDVFICKKNMNYDFNEPEYCSFEMNCGLEDLRITDPYEAMEYGFNEAVRMFVENNPRFKSVFPETVSQYIGFKDSKKNKIFENDILLISMRNEKKYFESGNSERCIVKYNKKFAKYYLQCYSIYGGEGICDGKQMRHYININGSYVGGNIFDNPELLLK